jgi:light-harvesting complex I chlorophyll a/b binding protein 1
MLLQESWHPLFGGKVLGAAAWHFQQTQSLYPFWWIPLLAGISITEFVTIRKGWEQPEDVKGTGRPASMSPDYVPGDLNFDPLKLSPPVGSDKFIDYRNKELQNGRLAMLAIAGMVAQELVDGRGILQHIYEVGLFKRG